MTPLETIQFAIQHSPCPAQFENQLSKAVIKPLRIKADYLDFLQRQSFFTVRGEKWQELMRRRKECLKNHTDTDLLEANYLTEVESWWIVVHPENSQVIFWEWWTKNDVKTS